MKLFQKDVAASAGVDMTSVFNYHATGQVKVSVDRKTMTVTSKGTNA